MRITCESCGTPYAVDDRRIAAGGARLQCPRCSHQQVAHLEGQEGSSSPRAEPPAPEPAVTELRCSECGALLDDPLDQGLGTCGACRDAADRALQASTALSRRQRVPRPEDLPAAGGRTLIDRLRSSPVALGAVSVVVLLGGYLAIRRPWISRAPLLAAPAAPKRAQEVLVAEPEQPALSGDAAEVLLTAERQLALGTATGDAQALKGFREVLVGKPEEPRAIAGLARALSRVHGGLLDERVFQDTLGLLTLAEGNRGAEPSLLLAHAELLLARSSPASYPDVRALAERVIATGKPAEKAEGQLAIGRTYLETNSVWASERFEKARALEPELMRLDHYRALAHASNREYAEAIAELERRVSSMPDRWLDADALARLYLDVGETARARATYRRHLEATGTKWRPSLMLAVLAYQHEDKAQDAVAALQELVSTSPTLQHRERAEALTHLAAAERSTGATRAAIEHARQAREEDPDNAAATLQMLLLGLSKPDPAVARQHLGELKGRLPLPGLEKLLEGRTLLAEGHVEQGIRALSEAAELDPRRVDALLLAGAAASRAKQLPRAYELVLRRAATRDPTQSGPRQVLTSFYLSPADLLRPAQGAFAPLAEGRDDPNPMLCEGIVAFHLGELAGADQRFSRVLALDRTNGIALAYRALLSLGRAKVSEAVTWGERAVEGERQLGLAHQVLGAALAVAGKAGAAERALREALKIDAHLLGARVKLAELELKGKRPDEARRLCATVLELDPSSLDAKRALYLMGKEEG